MSSANAIDHPSEAVVFTSMRPAHYEVNCAEVYLVDVKPEELVVDRC